MTSSRRAHRHRLRHSALATAAVLALLSSPPTLADSTVTISVSSNNWIGGTSDDWFTASNWEFGGLFNLPSPVMPVYIGPLPQTVNGFPVAPKLPVGEAVLGGVFNAPSLTMHAWDGPSQLRLVAGGSLTTSGTVGGLNSYYTATGAIQAATLVLDGGQIAGSWNFLAHSRVVVNAGYGLPGGSWSGDLGDLQINSGAALTLPGGALNVGRISNAGALSLSAGSQLTVAGDFQNAGQFTIGGSGSTGTSALYLSGNTSLSGSGSTMLTDANYSYVGGNSLLTVASGHTLRGAGYVASNLANQGTVIADGMLTVAVNAAQVVDGTGGRIQVANAGTLAVSSGTLRGGTVQGLGSGSRLGGNGTFQQLALSGDLLLTGATTLRDVSSSASMRVVAGGSVSLAGTLANTGTLTVLGSGNVASASLYVVADTTLSGSGSTVLTDANYSYVGGDSTLTVASGHTLRGAGYVGSKLANQGSVIADGTLTIAVNGSHLVDNTGGQVQVASAGTLVVSAGTLKGGSVQGLGTGSQLGGNGTFQQLALSGDLLLTGGTTLRDVSSDANLRVASGGSVSLAGTLANTGTLTVLGSGNVASASVYLLADTTLSGGGSTVLTDANYSYVGGSKVLTVGNGHTLRGAGYVASNLANRGSVIADGTLTVGVNTASTVDNVGGQIQVANAGNLVVSAGTLSGGNVQGLGTGSRLGGNGSFQQLALSGDLLLTGGTTLRDMSSSANLRLQSGSSVSLAGTVANTGTFTVLGSGDVGSASVYLAGATTLAGSGSTVLTDANYSYIGGNAVLTVASGHTLRGAGYVASKLANQGTVIADGTLTVNAGSNASFVNSGGLVQVGNSGRLLLSGGSFSGGTVQGLGAGSRIEGAGTFQDLTLAGQFLVAPSSVALAGTITNTGTLTVSGSGSTGSAAIYLAGATTLTGNGSTVLTDANYSQIGGSALLTIGSGHTVRGAGYVTTSVANQGSVVATGVLSVNAGSGSRFTNSGRLQVDAGAQLLDAAGVAGLVQTGAGAVTVVNGLLRAPTLTLNAGTLQGSGTVQADVLNLGGTINAGNSPGKLSVTGNLTLGDDSLLLVEVAGPVRGTQYDWLAVSGNVALDGDLQLVFTGYTPQVGEQFAFLTSGGSFSGRFDNAWANGWSLDLQYGAQGVTATVTAVPEPGNWALLLLGTAGLGAWLRRRRATGH